MHDDTDSAVDLLRGDHAKAVGRLLSQLAEARSEILNVKKQHGELVRRYQISDSGDTEKKIKKKTKDASTLQKASTGKRLKNAAAERLRKADSAADIKVTALRNQRQRAQDAHESSIKERKSNEAEQDRFNQETSQERHSAPETLFSSFVGANGAVSTGSTKPKSPRFGRPDPCLRVNPTEYAAQRKWARENASRIKREALEKSADGLTFSPNLNLSQRGKGKAAETNAYAQMPVLELSDADAAGHDDGDCKGDGEEIGEAEKKVGKKREVTAAAIEQPPRKKNSNKKRKSPQSPSRKNKMGLLLCKRKLRGAAAAAASSSKAGTISFAQLFRPFVKSYSMESMLDMRAFVSLVRGAGKIPKSMLDNAELEGIFQAELLSQCKPGAPGVPLGLLKAWIINGQEGEQTRSTASGPDVIADSQFQAKRPSKLTPPTVKRSSRNRKADKLFLSASSEVCSPRCVKTVESMTLDFGAKNASTVRVDAEAARARETLGHMRGARKKKT